MRQRHVIFSQRFFAKVQNKLHFAIHGYTADELIAKRADSKKTYGLSNVEEFCTW